MNAVSMSRLSQIKGDIFNALQFLSPQAREEFANELNQWLASQLTKRAADICPRCEGVGQYVDYIGKRVCSLCDGTGKCR